MNCYDWAVDEMLEAINLESEVGEFHYSLGVAYLMLSKIPEAKEALLKSLEIQPDEPDALAFLGYVYLLEHNFEMSHKILQRALEIDPNNFLRNTIVSSMKKWSMPYSKISMKRKQPCSSKLSAT